MGKTSTAVVDKCNAARDNRVSIELPFRLISRYDKRRIIIQSRVYAV